MARPNGADAPRVLPSIPLEPELPPDPAEQSIGTLVRDATEHVSTLVRAEMELAKIELTAEVKKGVQGSIFFVVALTIMLFSLFFGFFALAETISIWLGRAWGFTIVFAFMLLVAGLCAFIGYLRVKRIRKPERTISTLQETAQLFSGRGQDTSLPSELQHRP